MAGWRLGPLRVIGHGLGHVIGVAERGWCLRPAQCRLEQPLDRLRIGEAGQARADLFAEGPTPAPVRERSFMAPSPGSPSLEIDGDHAAGLASP